MPATCPVCGTPIVQDEGAVRHYCPNLACPARVGQEFGHFVASMDIEGAGYAVLKQLTERGLVKTRGDFFRLSVEDLESLDRYAKKSAENLYGRIQRARRGRPLARILAALGIPQVGWQTAIDLASWLVGCRPGRARRAARRDRRLAGPDRPVPPRDRGRRPGALHRGDGRRADRGRGTGALVHRAGQQRRPDRPRRCRRRAGTPGATAAGG